MPLQVTAVLHVFLAKTKRVSQPEGRPTRPLCSS